MAVLEKLNPPETIQELTDLAGKIRRLRYTETKLLKASDTARAAIALTPDIIDISAPDADDSTKTVGISVIGQSGTVIRGPAGLTTTPGNIRIAGLWKLNDLLLSAAPSTILTPIPVLRFSLPMDAVKNFVQVAKIQTALAGVV